MKRFSRWILLLLLTLALTGCFDWIRAYRTYLQMDAFDEHFAITVDQAFSIQFKDPILYSDDFVSLSKLQPSAENIEKSGKIWRYWFRKVDEGGKILQPETKFYFDLSFNKEQRLTQWTFSPLFLQLVPAEFLEVSLRSLSGAKINKDKKQLKANTDSMEKISAELPDKEQMLAQLKEPLEIEKKGKEEVYHYHFLLETRDIEEGYEDRALSAVKLTFDQATEKLIKMSGRFVGLKISIDYRKFLDNQKNNLTTAAK